MRGLKLKHKGKVITKFSLRRNNLPWRYESQLLFTLYWNIYAEGGLSIGILFSSIHISSSLSGVPLYDWGLTQILASLTCSSYCGQCSSMWGSIAECCHQVASIDCRVAKKDCMMSHICKGRHRTKLFELCPFHSAEIIVTAALQ